jgi:hypothetical protein
VLSFAGDDRLHQVVQVELLLVLLSGSILYLNRNSHMDEATDAALSGALFARWLIQPVC